MVEVHISLPMDTVDILFKKGYLEYNKDWGYYYVTSNTSAKIGEFLNKLR